MKSIFKKTIRLYLNGVLRTSYKKLYKKIKKLNNFNSLKVKGEDEWYLRWKALDTKVNVDSYRIFSSYIGNDFDICPLESCAIYIEPSLNSGEYAYYYEDKNVFDALFDFGTLPNTIFRCINGIYLNDKYNVIDVSVLDKILINHSRVIVKPSVGGESGRGIELFNKSEQGWFNLDNKELTIPYLENTYKGNFIVQEVVKQSAYMSIFNKSSVNTIRIMTYRSVKTDQIVIPNAILRIGSLGSYVDNAHSGGRFIGVTEDGVLGKYTCDYLGSKQAIFNGIDFSTENFIIPNYDKVRKFAIEVAEKIPHMRLLALDILLDENNLPKLIEFNSTGFSAWLFQFTNSSAFGEWTDEVLEYSISKKGKIKNKYLI